MRKARFVSGVVEGKESEKLIPDRLLDLLVCVTVDGNLERPQHPSLRVCGPDQLEVSARHAQ